MGCSKKGNSAIFSNLEVNKIENESIVDGTVLFWDNGKYLIVTSGSSCRLYSVATGEEVKKLFTCESKIISCHFNPRKAQFLIALSEYGELVQYDLESHVIKSTKTLKFNAEFLNKQSIQKFEGSRPCPDKKNEWDNEILNDVKRRKFFYAVPEVAKNFYSYLLWTSWSLNEESQCHVTVFMVKKAAQMEMVRLPKLPLKKCYKNFGVCKTSEESILYVGMGLVTVEVYHYMKGGLNSAIWRSHYLAHELTCLTLFGKELSFATADARGAIIVWRNILQQKPIKTLYQWHTVDINDLAFSDEGVHLYSGGDENVLVKWSFLSNQKDFLPRLSAPIRRISIAQAHTLVALSLANNEINIIDSNFKRISVIKTYSFYTGTNDKTGHLMTVDPRNYNLVLNATPGHLQFISTQDNFKVLYLLDICKANFMTGDKGLVNMRVTHAKFNKNGSLLVTAEERNDDVLKEYRLKFWHFNETKQTYTLNTSVELPHDENVIHSIEISNDDLVATSGGDKQFKLWEQFESSELHVTKTIWSVLSVGKYKLLPCGPIDFSDDASLIAVGFGPMLTLWDTNSCAFKCSLVAPFKRDNVKFIKFGKEEHSHLIVTATDFNITTWNIITLTMSGTVDLNVSYLVGDFFQTYMCVFSKSGTLFAFSPGSTSPEYVMENVTSSEVIAAQSAFSGSNEKYPYQLYFLNEKRELMYLGAKDTIEDESVNVGDVFITPFSALVAQKTGGGVTKSIADYVKSKSKEDSNYMSSILDAPAHTLQNPARFCFDFLSSLTESVDKSSKKSDATEKKTVENNNEIIEIADSGDDGDNNDDVIEIVDTNDEKDDHSNVSEESLRFLLNSLFKFDHS